MPVLDLDLDPAPKALRVFGVGALVFFGVLGVLGLWRLGFPPALGWGLAGLGLLSGFFAVAAPRANRPLYVLLTVLVYPIGWIVSHVMLGLLFYGVLTPVGLLFRLCGRDAMRRRPRPEQDSFWVPRSQESDLRRYFRQF